MRPDPLAAALFLTVAFVLAGLAHSAWLGTRLSRRLMMPLDGGLRVRGRRVFGDNKTVRGFVVIVPATSVTFAGLFAIISLMNPEATSGLWTLSEFGYAALGAWAGLGFMAGELPNSFVKRQLDIGPGLAPRGSAATMVSFVVDRIDSILGMLVALSTVVPTPALTWLYVLLIGPGIHLAFSALLYRLGVKARPA
jgi:CDP-2,3-bis-(O-geranylgeranyl)-sn-glycerol synthase